MLQDKVDCVQGICGPPQGDSTLAEARGLCNSALGLWGGIAQDFLLPIIIQAHRQEVGLAEVAVIGLGFFGAHLAQHAGGLVPFQRPGFDAPPGFHPIAGHAVAFPDVDLASAGSGLRLMGPDVDPDLILDRARLSAGEPAETKRVLADFAAGKVDVEFVVERDGAVSAMRVVESSGSLSLEEIADPKGWILLAMIMDPRTGLGRFREFRVSNYQLMMDLIAYCRHHGIDEILAEEIRGTIGHFYRNFHLGTRQCSVKVPASGRHQLRSLEQNHVTTRSLPLDDVQISAGRRYFLEQPFLNFYGRPVLIEPIKGIRNNPSECFGVELFNEVVHHPP